MPSWSKVLHQLAWRLETGTDQLLQKLRKKLRPGRAYHILLYHSYATDEWLYIHGRVLKNRNIQVSDTDGLWTNARNSYKRLLSRECPYARVEIAFREQTQLLQANEEGYIEFHLALTHSLPDNIPVLPISASLVEPYTQPPAKGVGKVFLPSPQAEYGVISDIDDTIMLTEVNNLRKMAQLTFFRNAYRRKVFPGTAGWYQALEKGLGGQGQNPIFYVSSSPWNLYDLIRDVLNLNHLPAGPIFLQDFGLDQKKLLVQKHGVHKMRRIRQILDAFPDLKFLLIGDTGEQDAYIYYDIAKEYPDRIACIYLRQAVASPQLAPIQALVKDAAKAGIEMLVVPDAISGVRHGVRKGFLAPNALSEVSRQLHQG